MKRIVAVILFIIAISTNAFAEGHIYDNAVAVEQKNAVGVVGAYSVIEIENKNDLTLNDVEDWFFNYVQVEGKRFNYYLITCKDSNLGVYANELYVSVGVELEIDSFGNIVLKSSEGAKDFFPKEGSLVKH